MTPAGQTPATRRARPGTRVPLVVGAGRARPAADRGWARHPGVGPRRARRYLDFSSQLVNVNIGHQHPAVVAAIQEQAATLATIAPATANLTRGVAAQRIAARAPEGFNKVFFTNGGADAIENAIRMARLHTGRDKVVSTYRSLPRQHRRCDRRDRRLAAACPTSTRGRTSTSSGRTSTARSSGRPRRSRRASGRCSTCAGWSRARARPVVAAILLETIPGTAGILMPPPGYLAGVRALADEYGIMLILDEVMAGFGRTGEWFALDAYDVVPDLITFAKGVNSGYVPVGGVVISDPIAAHLRRPGVPGRPHLQRPSAGHGVDRRVDRRDGRARASSPTRARSAPTCSDRASRRWPTSTR